MCECVYYLWSRHASIALLHDNVVRCNARIGQTSITVLCSDEQQVCYAMVLWHRQSMKCCYVMLTHTQCTAVIIIYSEPVFNVNITTVYYSHVLTSTQPCFFRVHQLTFWCCQALLPFLLSVFHVFLYLYILLFIP